MRIKTICAGAHSTGTTEFCFRAYQRYSAGFVDDWNSGVGSGCSGNNKKWFLFDASGGGTRFDCLLENGELIVYRDVNSADRVKAQVLGAQNCGIRVPQTAINDGNAHRFTLHVKAQSGTGITDGQYFYWVDGALTHVNSGFDIQNTSGWGELELTGVYNQGSPQNQTEWNGGVDLWKPA